MTVSIEADEGHLDEIVYKIESGVGRAYFGDSRSINASPLGNKFTGFFRSIRLSWRIFRPGLLGSVALFAALVALAGSGLVLALLLVGLSVALLARQAADLRDIGDRRNKTWNFRVWHSWFHLCYDSNRTNREWITFDDASGKIFFPKLLSVRWVEGQGLRLDFRKLPSPDNTATRNFEAMKETIRGALGFTQGRVITYDEPGKREVVTFILTNYRLPNSIAATIEMLRSPEGVVPVGISLGNIFLWWNQLLKNHGLVSGETNFGKSTWLRFRIVKALWDGWDCWAFDGKRIDLGWLRALGQRVWANDGTVTTVNSFWKTIKEEIELRQQVMDAAAVTSNWGNWIRRLEWLYSLHPEDAAAWLANHGIDTPLEELPSRRILIVVDEAGSVTRGSSKLHKSMHEDIAKIVEVARALGMYVVFGVQRPDVKNLAGDMGGSVRAQLNFVLAVGETEEFGRKMMFGTEHMNDPDVQAASGARTTEGEPIPGRAAVLGADTATNDVLLAQLPWISEEDAMRIIMARRPETDTARAHKWIDEAYRELINYG
jgi:hypothetical protein